MRLATVNPLVGLAEGTHFGFDALDEPEQEAPLFLAAMPADRTGETYSRHGAITVGDRGRGLGRIWVGCTHLTV